MAKTQNTNSKRKVADRWTKALAEDGFVPVTHSFLECYHELKPYSLTHGEAMFVIHLMYYKWSPDAPYPAFKSIASSMGVSDKQARRYAQSLETKKLLIREFKVGAANRFDLTPLFRALERHRKKAEQKK